MSTVSEPQVVTTCRQVAYEIAAARAAGRTIGLVPTMGALHEGHLSLVEASRQACDLTVVTIFVNPIQFGAGEDLDRYPRSWHTDLQALRDHQVDLVFAPYHEEMYPADFSTYVQPPALAELLEGRSRPDHFRGVVTVVLKLFHLIPADIAFFGEKDYQQLLVVRQMVRDLNVPIEVRGCPIVRDQDGLALSSRNIYLDPDQRRRALGLWRSLQAAAEQWDAGQRDPKLLAQVMQQTLFEAGVDRIEYAVVVDPNTLQEPRRFGDHAHALVAAQVGSTRLIDNRRLGEVEEE